MKCRSNQYFLVNQAEQITSMVEVDSGNRNILRRALDRLQQISKTFNRQDINRDTRAINDTIEKIKKKLGII
ncbi:MAG: hypothetical protein Q9M91_06490 [Candidatus Dojkabacteria bacterium]|nr:hypothetical protein [Candidatus Dojkabacteria bacterium]MDQ7021444.1 hypothetical protein [Candidatus Dojkabacteria bacterium]